MTTQNDNNKGAEATAMIDIPAILAQLQQHYDNAVRSLRDDVIAFGRDGTIPPPHKREDRSYAYPQIILRYAGVGAAGLGFNEGNSKVFTSGINKSLCLSHVLFHDRVWLTP